MIKIMTYDSNGYTNKIIQDGVKILGLSHIVRTWDYNHRDAGGKYYCVKLIDGEIEVVLKSEFEDLVGFVEIEELK